MILTFGKNKSSNQKLSTEARIEELQLQPASSGNKTQAL